MEYGSNCMAHGSLEEIPFGTVLLNQILNCIQNERNEEKNRDQVSNCKDLSSSSCSYIYSLVNKIDPFFIIILCKIIRFNLVQKLNVQDIVI